MTILAGIYSDLTFLDLVRVLLVRSHLVQALLIWPRFCQSGPIQCNLIRSDAGFVGTRSFS